MAPRWAGMREGGGGHGRGGSRWGGASQAKRAEGGVGWDLVAREGAHLGIGLAAAAGVSNRQTAAQRWPCMKRKKTVS